MERIYGRIVNFNVAVKECDGKVVFLRKLTPGGSAHSFGIHVARLAGMPKSIVARATEVMSRLEKAAGSAGDRSDTASQLSSLTLPSGSEGGYQLSLFQLDDPVLSQVRDEILHTDINTLTPMAALNKLHQIKTIITGRED